MKIEMEFAIQLTNDILGHIKNANFGLAKNAVETLKKRLSDINNKRI